MTERGEGAGDRPERESVWGGRVSARVCQGPRGGCEGPRGGCARGLEEGVPGASPVQHRPTEGADAGLVESLVLFPKPPPPPSRQALLGIASLPLLPRSHQPVMEWLVRRVRKAVDEAEGAAGTTECSGRAAVQGVAVQGAVHGAVQVAASRAVRVVAEKPGVRAAAAAAMAVAQLALAQMAAAEAQRPSAALRKGKRAAAGAEAAAGVSPSPAPPQQQQQPSSSSKKKRRRSLPEGREAEEGGLRAAKRPPQGEEAEEERAARRSAASDAAAGGSRDKGLPVTKAAAAVQHHVSSGPEEVSLSRGESPPLSRS